MYWANWVKWYWVFGITNAFQSIIFPNWAWTNKLISLLDLILLRWMILIHAATRKCITSSTASKNSMMKKIRPSSQINCSPCMSQWIINAAICSQTRNNPEYQRYWSICWCHCISKSNSPSLLSVCHFDSPNVAAPFSPHCYNPCLVQCLLSALAESVLPVVACIDSLLLQLECLWTVLSSSSVIPVICYGNGISLLVKCLLPNRFLASSHPRCYLASISAWWKFRWKALLIYWLDHWDDFCKTIDNNSSYYVNVRCCHWNHTSISRVCFFFC